ncbi:MAG: thioredoxin family protein [Bacteroidota bacterium]
MAEQFFLDQIPHNGWTYDEFVENMRLKVEMPEPEDQHDMHASFIPLNYRRTLRIARTFRPMPSTQYELMQITKPQIWMLITEDWCVDSPYAVPIIAKLAKIAPGVDLRILERDLYPDIMDKYLTNGGRSIPKLVAFDEEGNELFQWGPRPAEAASLVRAAREKGESSGEYNKRLHAWYADDDGRTIEREIMDLLKPNFRKAVQIYDEPEEEEFGYEEDLLIDLDEIKEATDFTIEGEGLDGEQTFDDDGNDLDDDFGGANNNGGGRRGRDDY